MPSHRRVALPASALVLAGAAGAAVLTFLHGVNHVTAQYRLLDADLENNVPTWFSSAQFLGAALAAAGAARLRSGWWRVAWTLLALFALLLSLDETASLHEEGGRRLGEAATLSVTQPLAAVAAVLLLASVRAVTREVVPVAGRALMLAMVVLVVSQGCASIAGLLAAGKAVFLLEAVEDGTETLFAVALLAAGLLAAGHSVDLRPSAVRSEMRSWWRADAPRSMDLRGGDRTSADVRRPAKRH